MRGTLNGGGVRISIELVRLEVFFFKSSTSSFCSAKSGNENTLNCLLFDLKKGLSECEKAKLDDEDDEDSDRAGDKRALFTG